MKQSFASTIAIFILAIQATTAGAHELRVSARQLDGKVLVVADYKEGGEPAALASVKVLGPGGKAVAEGRTDKKGQWSWDRPADGDYVVVVESATGHSVRTRITVIPTVRAKVAFEGGAWSPVFSPDGRTLAVGRGKAVVLLDLETGKERATLTGHRNRVEALAYVPGGKMLASAGRDATIALWDLDTGKEKHTLESGRPAKHLLFLPGGKQLACAFDDGAVNVWDITTQKLVVTTYNWSEDGRRTDCACLWFDPATKSICTLARESRGDKVFAALFRYDVATGKERDSPDARPRFSYPRHILSYSRGAAASPDGQTVAFRAPPDSIRANRIHFWDVAAGKGKGLELAHTGDVGALAFSPDGKSLVSTTAGDEIIVWEVATGKEKMRLAGARGIGIDATFSPDGMLVAVIHLGGVLDVWKLGDDSTRKP